MLSFDELNPTGPGGLTAGTTLFSTAGSAGSGVLLDHATTGTFKFRTVGNLADAAITAGAGTFTGTLVAAGVTFPSVTTGTGNLVLATNPTVSSLIATGTTTMDTVLAGTALVVQSATAVSSATTTTAQNFLTGTTTANFGLYYGNGAPSFAAATGSVYMNTTGSSTSTRMYVKSSVAASWIAVTTAS
jgi:hypothetical protein